MTTRARRQYAGASAVKQAVATTLEALRAQGLDLDVAGISLSPDGGVTVLTGKPSAPHLSLPAGADDGWGDLK